MNNNRRAERPERHGLRVSVVGGALQVSCSCGTVVGGRRYEDATMMTLADLLELVRLHSMQLDQGQRSRL